MKFGKITATVFMAVAAVGITAGSAGAQATGEQAAQSISQSGADRGIDYQTTLSDDSKVVTTTVDSGKFEITRSGAAVALKSDTGATVAEVPLSYQLAGRSIPVTEEIAADGHSLTLTPQLTADDIAELKSIGSYQNLWAQVQQNIIGVAIGGVLGGMIGGVLGLGIFSIVTGPLGGLTGALIGGAAQGGQPFIDAVTAVATGQP